MVPGTMFPNLAICFSKDNDAARSGLLKYDVRSRKCEGDDAEATKTCKANREKYSSLQAIGKIYEKQSSGDLPGINPASPL